MNRNLGFLLIVIFGTFSHKIKFSLIHLDEKISFLKIFYAKSNGRPREKARAPSMQSSYISVLASHTINDPSVCLSTCLRVCLSVSLSVSLSVCLSFCPSVCLSVVLKIVYAKSNGQLS